MAFQPAGLRFAVAVGAVWLCAGAARAAPDGALVVAAIADDAQAVVIRGASLAPVAYSVGETVRGTPWRVTRIHRGEATLRSAHPYKGSPFELRVRIGQQLPANAAQPATPATGTQ